jgi:hypothetical protein
MPIEQRKLIFSEDEVLQAIQSYARRRPDFLPQGRVLGFRPSPCPGGPAVGLTVAVEMTYGLTRQAIEVEAGETDVVELLIRCCLENNIPIPRTGAKRAAVEDGRLVLAVDYSGEFPGG